MPIIVGVIVCFIGMALRRESLPISCFLASLVLLLRSDVPLSTRTGTSKPALFPKSRESTRVGTELYKRKDVVRRASVQSSVLSKSIVSHSLYPSKFSCYSFRYLVVRLIRRSFWRVSPTLRSSLAEQSTPPFSIPKPFSVSTTSTSSSSTFIVSTSIHNSRDEMVTRLSNHWYSSPLYVRLHFPFLSTSRFQDSVSLPTLQCNPTPPLTGSLIRRGYCTSFQAPCHLVSAFRPFILKPPTITHPLLHRLRSNPQLIDSLLRSLVSLTKNAIMLARIAARTGIWS